jgi:hypothetical protein
LIFSAATGGYPEIGVLNSAGMVRPIADITAILENRPRADHHFAVTAALDVAVDMKRATSDFRSDWSSRASAAIWKPDIWRKEGTVPQLRLRK